MASAIRHSAHARRAWAAGLLIGPSAATGAAERTPCTLQALEIPIEIKGQHAVATVKLDGASVPLMVDSGAAFSMLTPAAARRLKLNVRYLPENMRVMGVTGEFEAGAAYVRQIELIGGKAPGLDFIVGGREFDNGAMGLLGRNILALADVEYDLGHGRVRLAAPQGDCGATMMAYWAGERPVSELATHRYHSKIAPITADVTLNGRSVRAQFDTGASISTITLAAARRLGLTPGDMEPAGEMHGLGPAGAKSWTATIAELDIGGARRSNFRARIADFHAQDVDLLIGMDFFLAHRIYVSKAQRRLYFTRNTAADDASATIGDRKDRSHDTH